VSARSLWGKQGVGKIVRDRCARVYGAAQVEGAALAEAWSPQSVIRNGHLQQREGRGIGGLGAAKGGSLNHYFEGTWLVTDRRDRVLVGCRKRVRAGVGDWSRARGVVCQWLLR
jgi:hypothetical protein